jgi:hypothetical protein
MSSPAGLAIKNNINDMNIGDCIPFRYTATTSGAVGYFSELGTCTATEIPVSGSATPNGLAYFIKVDKGLYICDRIVQHSIAWDTLNKTGYIEGKQLYGNTIIPQGITKDNNQGYILTADNIRENNEISYGPYKMFNGSDWQFNSGSSSIQANLFIELPIEQAIYGLTFRNGNYTYAISYKLYGSRDNISFDTLISNGSVAKGGTALRGTNQNAIKYKYIKFFATFNYGGAISAFNIFCKPLGFIRSISGGNAYLGTDNKYSLTNQSLGGYPVNNEWDKYIVNSNLNGKITPGDNNIWHWDNLTSLMKDIPINGIKDITGGNTTTTNSYRIIRGYKDQYGSLNRVNIVLSGSVYADTGFRPVLQYIESDSKQTNMYY